VAVDPHDPYLRLKNWPTPEDEICACPPGTPIKLMAAEPNPIHCLRCNLEVRPERLGGLTAREVDDVADWNATFSAISWLELESGAYERWARTQLLDLNSQPNIDGRMVTAMLNEKERCYFWLWQPEADEDWAPPSSCPYCSEQLARYDEGIFPQLLCERDSIVVVGR